ncbi:FecCD family ABC transporter permease [Ningiella sp. W23]|uniref:FecCD family ABC transporter permease n=1 Tax=Ningiella sp. W23 TaxID=3023715 RepID=UPI0037563C3B
MKLKRAQHLRYMAALVVALPIVIIWSLNSGVLDINLADYLIPNFTSDGADHTSFNQAILWEIRLPRIVMTLVTGAGLALCGVVLQALCRNPLADPGLIGVSSGAALFAAMGFYMASVAALPAWLPDFMLQGFISMMAAVGASLALILLLKIASSHAGINTLMLILAGVAINAGAVTLLGFVNYLADDETLRQITFWTLGSYAGINLQKAVFALVVISAAYTLFYRKSHAMMLISASEKQARYQGINVHKTKRHLLLVVALVVAVSVCFTGIVGFVGLVVPHLCRMAISSHLRILLPSSALVGAMLVTLADTFARTVLAPAELPIGLLTSLIGVPFFLYLIVREKRRLSFV